MKRDARAYWIWLQNAFGAGSPKPVYLAKRFPDLVEFYEGGAGLWSSFQFVREGETAALKAFTLSAAEARLEYADKVEQKVLCYEDEAYPQRLREIDAPPAVLYLKGELPEFDGVLTITVVGARKATPGAQTNTELLCYELSKAGAIVVSGGAMGIDAAAHRGALKGASPTACVLGCGIGYPYLMQNEILRNRIVERGGVLISEYPVNTGVYKGSFGVRNRILTGLCNGVLVTEAQAKGGTMLSVAHATRQNKDIFAVPGDVSNPFAAGPNRLIQDGAVPVLSAQDILREYAGRYEPAKAGLVHKSSRTQTEPSELSGVSKNAQAVYKLLSDSPVHISEIAAYTGLKVSFILAAATELELLGHIKSYSGQRYAVNSKKE